MGYNSIYNLVGLNVEVDRLQTQANLGFEKEFRTLKWLGLKDGMKILDVGAGPGFYTELLLDNLPSSHITLLEVSNELMDISKKKLSSYGERVDFVNESIFKNQLEDNQYDFVICRFVFQHLQDPLIASKEIYRILKPGGIVAIIDSDRGLWGLSDPEYLATNGKGYMSQIEKRVRWNREIGRNLVKILKNTGFSNLDFETVTIHSDLVGINNIIKEVSISNEQYRVIAKINPRLAKIIKMSKETLKSDKATIIFLNLIAKGQIEKVQ